MVKERLKKIFPSWQNALLALLAAGLLILAFPDFEWWFLAWFALVPLMWAVERERSVWRSFLLGWLFGTAFFFGTCWWLTYAPIHYAAIPWPVAYFLIVIVCLITGIFPGIFTAILSLLFRRFGSWAVLAAPFVWVFSEFLRYGLTGNNWNALGYSQAFVYIIVGLASLGGSSIVGFLATLANSLILIGLHKCQPRFPLVILVVMCLAIIGFWRPGDPDQDFGTWHRQEEAKVIFVQPNVPMGGLDNTKLGQLRQRQIEMAESAIRQDNSFWPTNSQLPTAVILPESPMNFMYNDDREFQQFIADFARRNNVSVLFNSAEPDATNGKYFNSAVMVGPDGKEFAQYDKLYLLPFGEAVPRPLEGIVPGFVGNFSYGREYDLLPLGDAKAGVMICFESHFGQLAREYVRKGADAIIEMTNDGYLGPTPVLRQHLANAVFRAVETNRPVLRVTNVGITVYIDGRGNVLDPLPSYTEGTGVWTVSKSDGSHTFYVKYGDWFAWLCTIVTILLVAMSFKRKTA